MITKSFKFSIFLSNNFSILVTSLFKNKLDIINLLRKVYFYLQVLNLVEKAIKIAAYLISFGETYSTILEVASAMRKFQFHKS
jgi:hypothetical protein